MKDRTLWPLFAAARHHGPVAAHVRRAPALPRTRPASVAFQAGPGPGHRRPRR